jgi:hypothetical protein
MSDGRATHRSRTRRPRGGEARAAGREHEALLDDLALHDRHGAARDVVVVEARVAALRPRDHPDVDVGHRRVADRGTGFLLQAIVAEGAQETLRELVAPVLVARESPDPAI